MVKKLNLITSILLVVLAVLACLNKNFDYFDKALFVLLAISTITSKYLTSKEDDEE